MKKIRKIKTNIKKSSYSCEKNEYIKLMIIAVIGVIIGIYYLNSLDQSEVEPLMSDVDKFLSINVQESISKSVIWNASVLYNNLKYIILIAVICIFTNLKTVIHMILFYKGMSYGFTVAFIIKSYGMLGVKIASYIYIPYAIIYFLIYIVAAYNSINMRKERYDKKIYRKYIIKIIILCILTSVISIVETYSVPMILKILEEY